jgi:hypothetical protein
VQREKLRIIESDRSDQSKLDLIKDILDVMDRVCGAYAWRGFQRQGRGAVLFTLLDYPSNVRELPRKSMLVADAASVRLPQPGR